MYFWSNVFYFPSQKFYSQEASEERTAGWGGEWRTGQRRGRLTGDSTSGQKRPVLWRRQLTFGPITWQMHPRTDTDTQTPYESIVWDPFTYDPALNYGQLELLNWKQAISTLVNQHGNVSTIYPRRVHANIHIDTQKLRHISPIYELFDLSYIVLIKQKGDKCDQIQAIALKTKEIPDCCWWKNKLSLPLYFLTLSFAHFYEKSSGNATI